MLLRTPPFAPTFEGESNSFATVLEAHADDKERDMIQVPPSVKTTDQELVELGDRMASRISVDTGSHMTTGRYDEGMAVRREVLGDSYVEQANAKTTDFTRDFQQIVTEFAWGTVWTRPGLDRRSRSMVTLTALVALGHHDELALHLRGALRNGLTREEIKEVLLQAAVYCGVPAANAAFRVAQRVFEELE